MHNEGNMSENLKATIKVWFGEVPSNCDLCRIHIKDSFVDGRTSRGPWACMCVSCHDRYGVGLGTGRGQRYEVQQWGGDNPRWIKVQG